MAGVQGELEATDREGTTEAGTTDPGGATASLEGATVSVHVFVRSMAPPGGGHDEQVAVLERLNALEDRGPVDAWNVTIWGERLCECEVCTATAAGRAVTERMWELREWAGRAEGDVALPFERREVTSEFAGTEIEALVPPRLTIAVYADEDLARVYPCTADGTHHSVTEGLDWLESAGRRVPQPPAE